MSSSHRLEGTYLSDRVEVDKTRFDYDADTGSLTDPIPGTKYRGGGNAILRYTGMLGNDFMITAQAGRNDFDRYDRSAADACPYALDGLIIPGVAVPVGCWVNAEVDSWSVGPNLTLDLGLRWESYENRNAAGETFLEISDQLAPRLGVVWDPRGDGRTKLYASAGLYHLPYPTQASVNYAAAVTQTSQAFILEGGINPDGSPEGLGAQILDWVW
jgi:hypothetical protein